MSYAAREAVWLRILVRECFSTNIDLRATVLFGDKEGAMNLAYIDVVNDTSKQIAVKYFFSKEKVKDGTVVFNYIPISHNASDIFTKILCVATHREMAGRLGMGHS